MINKGDVVTLKSDNRKMTVDGFFEINSREIGYVADKGDLECFWYDGKFIKYAIVSPIEVDEVIETGSRNETFQAGDVVTLKSGGPRFVIEKIDGDEVFLNNISNTYNSWLFKKV